MQDFFRLIFSDSNLGELDAATPSNKSPRAGKLSRYLMIGNPVPAPFRVGILYLDRPPLNVGME